MHLVDDQHLKAIGKPLDLDKLLLLIHLPLGVLLQPSPLALRCRLKVGGIQREVPFALLEESSFGQWCNLSSSNSLLTRWRPTATMK